MIVLKRTDKSITKKQTADFRLNVIHRDTKTNQMGPVLVPLIEWTIKHRGIL